MTPSRWPIIRHLRFAYHAYRLWETLTAKECDYLDAVWEGKA